LPLSLDRTDGMALRAAAAETEQPALR